MTPGLEAMEADSEDDLPVQFEADSLEYGDHDTVTARLTINYLTHEVSTNSNSCFVFYFNSIQELKMLNYENNGDSVAWYSYMKVQSRNRVHGWSILMKAKFK